MKIFQEQVATKSVLIDLLFVSSLLKPRNSCLAAVWFKRKVGMVQIFLHVIISNAPPPSTSSYTYAIGLGQTNSGKAIGPGYWSGDYTCTCVIA